MRPYSFDWKQLEQTHDLSLPEWGPYSNLTFGLSHIHDKEAGSRLDMTLMPGFYRRPLAIPDARKPSGGIPWHCSTDLKRYSYREQLEWKDKVYADLEFIECTPHVHLLRCHLVNRTSHTEELALQLLTRLIHARKCNVTCSEALEILHPVLPGCGLVSDAMHSGEEETNEPVFGGSVYSVPAGTLVQFHPETNVKGKDLYLYRKSGNFSWQLEKLNGQNLSYIAAKDEIINRLLVVSHGVKPVIQIETAKTAVYAEFPAPGKYLLSFDGKGDCYGIYSERKPSFHRNYLVPDLAESFSYCDYVLQKHAIADLLIPGGTEGGFAIAVQPIQVAPHSEEVIDFRVWNGSRKTVQRALEKIHLPEIPPAARMPIPESPYSFSQERMASVIMTNVIYPISCNGQFIRNHTPGRLWNSLYTWDSGFIGLALLDLDITRAIENLNAYLTKPGDKENAFVLHGTPLPVQIFLLYEIWNRTNDLELLKAFYPRIKQMYNYLAGHAAGSTTRSHCTEPLICTWDYFYNSGGWDDYPPQWHYTCNPGLSVIPAISSSCVIRSAKMLRALAGLFDGEVKVYDRDIADLSRSLQMYSWDTETGYFSYVTLDAKKRPNGFYRYTDGSNYNMGLDGTSPLIAGAVTAEQRKILWDKIQSPEHLWTPYGISTVDRSATYFTHDGYWNGSVWFPHQWFLWKAALNDGLGFFAEKIAKTALRHWEQKTKKSYACFEQFSAGNGSGMGWHHFSGLSSPIICWHRAYFKQNALTAGYDVLVKSYSRNSWNLKIAGEAGTKTSVVFGGLPASVAYCGQKVKFRKTFGNAVVFDLPKNTEGCLKISS